MQDDIGARGGETCSDTAADGADGPGHEAHDAGQVGEGEIGAGHRSSSLGHAGRRSRPTQSPDQRFAPGMTAGQIIGVAAFIVGGKARFCAPSPTKDSITTPNYGAGIVDSQPQDHHGIRQHGASWVA